MKTYKRALAIVSAVALLSSLYATAGEAPPKPKPNAVKAADPPTKPNTPPPGGGFPVLAVPLGIALGAAAALGTQDDSVEVPSGTGTGTGTQ
ncbi:MAG TPA: hypothetical protein VED01_09845 [Burkholderiales bacterium]|nr:hypothetical protein [Burkholderiales bacterium]